MLKLFERSATGLAEEGNTEETPFNNTTRQVDREFLNQILLSTMQAWCQEQYSYLDEQRGKTRNTRVAVYRGCRGGVVSG